MAVVQVKTFILSTSPHPMAQADLDALSVTVNAYLAGITAANVLDVKGEFAPGGKNDIRSTYSVLVTFLG